MMFRRFIALCLVLISCTTVQAEALVWSEDFNTLFDRVWLTTPGFPDTNVNGSTVDYLGGPTVVFENTAGENGLRLNHILSDLQRVGFHSETVFEMSQGHVELRVNTLTQDLTRIDGLIELWMIDANDTSNFVRVCLFGSLLSTFRNFQTESSVDGYFDQPFEYANDTWYRVRLNFLPGQVVAELRADDGESTLASMTFEHDFSSTPFRIGVSQWMGFPGAVLQVDSAVDYVKVYGACGVETATVDEIPGVACPGQVTSFQAISSVTGVTQWGWRKDGNDLPQNDPRLTMTFDGAAYSLEIWPTLEGDSGDYTFMAEGSCGEVESNSVSLEVFATATGDANGDGAVDGRDIQAFTDFVVHGGFLIAEYCAADMDSSGFVDVNDAPLFAARLME